MQVCFRTAQMTTTGICFLSDRPCGIKPGWATALQANSKMDPPTPHVKTFDSQHGKVLDEQSSSPELALPKSHSPAAA